MDTPWTDNIKNTRQLSIYAGPSLRRGTWARAFQRALRDFNRLSRRFRLNVTLIAARHSAATPGGADIQADAANGQIACAHGGATRTQFFNGRQLHGTCFTFKRQLGQNLRIEKAFIFLPSQPQVNTPRGLRIVGENVMLVIAVHELVHACGLVAHSQTGGLFYSPLAINPGSTPAGDRVYVPVARRNRMMPPLILSGATVRRIRRLWT